MSHSEFSPSASKRWSICTESIRLIRKLRADGQIPEESPSSVYADEGTAAHESASTCLLQKTNSDNADIQFYLDAVRVEANKPGAVLMVEQRLNLFYRPSDRGTADAIVLQDGVMHIFDLKYGRGVEVSAIGNSQLRIYALSALPIAELGYDIHSVTMHIVQPRRDRNHSWENMTVEDLQAWGRMICETVQAIVDDYDVVYKASEETCMWCPAKGHCPAQQLDAVAVFEEVASDVLPPYLQALQRISDEQIPELLEKRKMLDLFLDSLHSRACDLASKGLLPGYAMVPGRTNRKWTDDLQASEVLSKVFGKKNIKKEVLITPAQAEKMMDEKEVTQRQRDKIQALITRPEGKHHLVKSNITTVTIFGD